MRECEPPDELRGTPEFVAFYTSLSKDRDLYKRIKDLLEILRGNMLVGEKVEKMKWPRIYVKKYGIRNLFRLDSGKEYRLTYTIIAEREKKIACVIEFFPSHKKYDQRFGYT